MSNSFCDNMKSKVLIWDVSLANLIHGQSFGGVAVQLYFWAQEFLDHEWEVYSLTNEKTCKEKNITFLKHKDSRFLSILLDFLIALYYLHKIKPNLILLRGASNRLFVLSIASRIFGCKIVFMGASDVNFVPGKETINNTFNRYLYQRGLKGVKYVVTQNNFQTETVKKAYGKVPLQLNNIWRNENCELDTIQKKYQIVWVANLRRLKRPEWFIEAARKLPMYSFAMAGDTSHRQDYKDELLKMIDEITNLDYLGRISFEQSSALIANSCILVCTSEFEGFPNTFLQAWSNNRPVISTVNPNDVITKYQLGQCVSSIDELVKTIQLFLNDHNVYREMQKNINSYFNKQHNSRNSFDRLMEYVNIN